MGVLIPFGSGASFDLGAVVPVAALGRVFMVPVDDCPAYGCSLRLDRPRNNQRRRVRFAEDYAFERWVESHISPRRVA